MKKIALISLMFVYSISLMAQNIGQWKAYPSLRSVNDITVDSEGMVWGASNGGVFKFDGEEFNAFSTIDGLSGQQVQVIAHAEATNKIYAGYADGVIDVIEVESGSTYSINDIARASNYTSRSINELVVYNNNLFAATDFGIVVIDLQNDLVDESFIQLGSINRASPVLSLSIQNNTIIAGTQSGVAVGNLNDELAIQENWQSFDESNGFISNQIEAVGIWNDQLYASAADGNYIYDGDTWQLNSTFGSNIIHSYQLIDDNIYAAISNNILFISTDAVNFKAIELGNLQSTELSLRSDGTFLFFGTFNSGFGMFHIEEEWVQLQVPDGPFQNNFKGMLVTEEGTMISGTTNSASSSGTVENGRGYYIYDGEWHNFNKLTEDVLNNTNFKLAYTTASTEDYFYIGSWGQGVARHHKESNEIYVFNERNSTIRGWVDDDPNYPVISGLATDSNDDVWLVSRFGTTPLYYQKPGDEDWLNFSKHNAAGSAEYYKLFVDSNDMKWIALQNTSTAGEGLLVIDTGEPDDASDDKAVRLTTGENSGNLPDQQVKAIIEDLNGEVWIGTERGIARFLFPEFVIDGTAIERSAQWLINEDTTATSRFLLRDVNVSTMDVNSANEKWIGTETQGIFVLNEEGSRIINRFTSENSPLYSNAIIDIEISELTGEVFISTDMGLISYTDIPKQAKSEMKELKVFPNPFSYTSHSQIVIDGLSENTTLKIVGVDGNVVQQLTARGGRISWNGLDFAGQKLGSGVYFVVAVDEEEGSRGMGKVVIIR